MLALASIWGPPCLVPGLASLITVGDMLLALPELCKRGGRLTGLAWPARFPHLT